MLRIHESFPLYNHMVITKQMKASMAFVPSLSCAPRTCLCTCWWYFPALPLLWISTLIWNLDIVWNRKFIRILSSFLCCSVAYLLWLTFTSTFDIIIHYTYENKFKVFILISSTLISFDISVLETTLLVRRLLLFFFSPQEQKTKHLSGSFVFLPWVTEERQPHVQDSNQAT